MAQIDTKYIKLDSDKKKKSGSFANRKGGIFLIVCALVGMSMDIIRLVRIINGEIESSLIGVLLWMCLGLALIVIGIIMIAKDRTPRKEG